MDDDAHLMPALLFSAAPRVLGFIGASCSDIGNVGGASTESVEQRIVVAVDSLQLELERAPSVVA